MALIDGKLYDFYGVDSNFFKLNGQVYEVLEDEVDGYRSSMKDVREVGASEASELIFFNIALARVRYRAEVKEAYRGGSDMFSELEDVRTGLPWLRFGTERFDDYYPCFMFRYTPHGGRHED